MLGICGYLLGPSFQGSLPLSTATTEGWAACLRGCALDLALLQNILAWNRGKRGNSSLLPFLKPGLLKGYVFCYVKK